MSIQYNVDLANTLVSSFEVFEGGTLEIRDGSQPASADDSATGTLLATITLPSDAFTAASGGSIGKNGTWDDTVDASGTAGYGRMIAGSGEVMDLNITETGGGGEMELDNTSLVQGGVVTVSTFNVTQPQSV